MKKFLTIFLTAIVLLSTLVAVGCKKTMYKFTLTSYNGVEYVVDDGIMSGAKIQDGYEVKFKVNVADDYNIGLIVVKANDTVLNKGSDGKYSVIMSADTLITVEGVAPVAVSKITFQPTSGVTYDIDDDIPSGAFVRKGYEVKFNILVDNGYEGTPIVKANDNVLTKGSDGKYSVVLNTHTTITVDGVSKPNTRNVAFDKGSFRIKYLDPTTKKELSTLDVAPGSTVNFLLDLSVYYIQDGYSVTANTELLEPDADGVYSFVANSNVTVSVIDLEQDYGFIDREDGGMGTQDNPFKIEKPIDLFYMAELINNDYYSSSAFYGAYYELVADIDLGGEQLFIIGDNTSTTAFFAGDFNGNGYTISNYYIDDEKVDQSTYASMFLPYIGMFGNVQPLTTRAPRIYDLNLKDFTIEVNAAKYQSTFMVGGLVASGMGVDITAVNVDGVIIADADVGYFGYMGGILGASVSASTTDGQTRYYSVVRASSSSVDISANSGYVYASGGIAGYIGTSDEITSSIILNCYNTGDVAGAMHTGGLVGYAGPYTSIISSYSTGDVVAQSTIASTGIAENDIYTYAYAGGLVGYIDYSTVVTDSFATGNVSAYTVEQGRDVAGNVYGKIDDATYFVHSEKAIILNSVGKEVAVDNDYIKNTLGWDTTDWVFKNDGYPVINMEAASKTITVTIDLGNQKVNGESTLVKSVKDMYIPMSIWYVQYDEATDGYLLPEFIDADAENVRSYGYFFDAELTKRVPYSYVPVNDVTLYAGFADYSEVAGEYAVKGQNGLTITLGTDGSFVYANGASVLETDYYYTGDYAILRSTAFARLGNYTDEETLVEVMSYYFNFKAEIAGDSLVIYDTKYFTKDNAFTAVKLIDGFKYGTYYANTSEYVFNKDGTGLVNGESATYVVDGTTITIETPSGTRTGTVSNDGYVTKIGANTLSFYDMFKGVWETKLELGTSITFDGKGNATFAAGGSTTYTLTDNGVVVNGSNFVYDGVSLTFNQLKFYRKNSFVGVWKYNNALEPIEISLNGLNDEGVGVAKLNYSNNSTILDGHYQVLNNGRTIEVYVGDVCYASLTKQNNNTITGEVISVYNNAVKSNVVFGLTDIYKGVWVSEITGLEKIEFNGYGLYNLSGTADYLSVKGQVTINGKTKVAYTADAVNGNAQFTYNNVTYTITYNFLDGSLYIAEGSKSYSAIAPDHLYGKTFVGDNGKNYVFDGRGNLPTGGTLTVDGDTTYTYKINGNTIDLGSDGNITIANVDGVNVYKFNVTGLNDNLTVKNSFTGSYYVSGYESDTFGLVIGKISAENTVKINYKGANYVGNFDGTIISFVNGDTTYYVHAYTGGEVAISTDLSGYGTNTVCVKTVDDLYGKYTITGGGYIFFDGLGNSRYVNGVAIVYNAQNEIVKVYSYEIDKNGNPLMVQMSNDSVVVEYLFVETADGDYVSSDSKKYSIIQVDELYLAKAKDSQGVVYLFDGIGSVTIDGVTKSYTIIEKDSAKRTITITITDGTTTQTAIINYVNTVDVTITFVD